MAGPGTNAAATGEAAPDRDASGAARARRPLQGLGGIASRTRARIRRALSSVRTRFVASFLILLTLATVVSVVAVRQVLVLRLDQRIDESLRQEIREFEILGTRGTDPDTGRRFTPDNLRALFDTFLARNVPEEGEELLAFVGGDVYGSETTARAAVSPLEENQALVDRWGALEVGETDQIDTPGGPVRYAVVPVAFEDGPVVGRFVVANFIEGEQQEVEEAVAIVAIVGLFVLLIGTVLASLAARRVLKPVRDLDDTARSITETDLTRRIRVSGHDELAELGTTFNTMVARLESAFESQREFIRDAGHELRTPITIVRGHLELLGDDPVERRQTIELVTDELDRMGRFVAELATLARADRPDFLRLETVDLRLLANELLSKASALAPRDWALEEAQGGVVVADRQRLTEAVMNLAENAAAQTSEGDRIALGTGLQGDWACLWVADSGPGIPLGDQDWIFERFKSGAGDARYAGSGLGLAIVRAIADSHGGRVELESSPGEGARFILRIPVDQPYDGNRQ